MIAWWTIEISSNRIRLDITHRIGARRGSRNSSAIGPDPAISRAVIATPRTVLHQKPVSSSSRRRRGNWTRICGTPTMQNAAAISVTTDAMATRP